MQDWKTMDVKDLKADWVSNQVIALALGMLPGDEVPNFTLTKDAAFQLVEYPVLPAFHHLKLAYHSPDVCYAWIVRPLGLNNITVGYGEAPRVELAICRAFLAWKQAEAEGAAFYAD